MPTNKERMLHMVLDDVNLQQRYSYDQSEYEDLCSAMNSTNVVVAAVAKIIMDLNGSTDETVQKKVYMNVSNYIKNNYLL